MVKCRRLSKSEENMQIARIGTPETRALCLGIKNW